VEENEPIVWEEEGEGYSLFVALVSAFSCLFESDTKLF
jgi:hypothetical protein